MNSCAPAENAEPGTIRVTGLVIAPVSSREEAVFTALGTPAARLARVSPLSSVLEDWRERAMLDKRFQATVLGWPVDVTLIPGKALDASVGLEPWRAEQATEGLLGHEPYFIETVSAILTEVNGIVLYLPGGQRTLIVAEDYFPEVRIGDPIAFSELGEAMLMDIDHPAAEPPVERRSGEDDEGDEEKTEDD